jgi:hypothetical protein
MGRHSVRTPPRSSQAACSKLMTSKSHDVHRSDAHASQGLATRSPTAQYVGDTVMRDTVE